MEGEGAETGKSFFGRIKDGVMGRISPAPKTAETKTKEEPKRPKVKVKSPLPSRTLGAKPPAWLEQQHGEIEEARKETERKEREAVAQVPQVPASEYASEFKESATEEQPTAQLPQTEPADTAAATGQVKTVEHLRPSDMTRGKVGRLKTTVGRIKAREEKKVA